MGAEAVPAAAVECLHRNLPTRQIGKHGGKTTSRGRTLQRLMQVDARLLPVALHGPLRDRLHRGNFGEREPAEELEVDDLREAGIDGGELVQRLADARELFPVGNILDDVGAYRRDLEQPTALLRLAAARI